MHIEGSAWRAWDCVALRGAGFPADIAMGLAARESISAVAGDLPADAFERDARATHERLKEVTDDRRFRTAIALQNPTVAGGSLRSYRNAADVRNSAQRRREILWASYLYRFTMKNDSIGFFGPIGWGRFGEQSRWEPEAEIVASTRACVSQWALDALVDRLVAGGSIDLPPVRASYVELRHNCAILPAAWKLPLSDVEFRVAVAADGGRSIAELAGSEKLNGAEVQTIVQRLRSRGILLRRPVLPVDDQGFERLQRHAVDAQRVDTVVSAMRASLRALESPDVDDDAVLTHLDLLAELCMGSTESASRSGAETPGHEVAYLDSRRAGELVLGWDCADVLTGLEMVAECAYWLMGNVAERVLAALDPLMERHQETSFASLYMEASALVHEVAHDTAAQCAHRIQDEWEKEISSHGADTGSVVLTREEAARAIARLGATPGQGLWNLSTYVAPDVMLAGPPARPGDAEFAVLGEMHIGVISMGTQMFLSQMEDPDTFERELDRDDPSPRLLVSQPRSNPDRLSTRVRDVAVRRCDYVMSVYDDALDWARPRNVKAADIRVVRADDGAWLLALPDGATFPLLDGFSGIIVAEITDGFSVVAPRRSGPRVSVERLVVGRRCWDVPAAKWADCLSPDPMKRFHAVRALAESEGMPQFVFCRLSSERRPLFVDLNAPVSVDALVRALERGLRREGEPVSVMVSEMLPEPSQFWLTDIDGARYSSEIRMTMRRTP